VQKLDGFYVAEIPSLPWLYFSGKDNRGGFGKYKRCFSLKKHNEPVPPSIEEEVVEVYA
jgi:hypothetical protein